MLLRRRRLRRYERVAVTDLEFLLPWSNRAAQPLLRPAAADGTVLVVSGKHAMLALVHPDRPHARLLPFPLRADEKAAAVAGGMSQAMMKQLQGMRQAAAVETAEFVARRIDDGTVVMYFVGDHRFAVVNATQVIACVHCAALNVA